MREWIGTVMADLRYALRTLRRAPAFTAIAITTLALGVGATTGIFSLVDGILLRPLPYPEPDRLVRVLQSYPEKGLDSWTLSQQNTASYRAGVHDFAHFAAWNQRGVTLTGNGSAERLESLLVTGDFFATLGVPAIAGRTVTDAEVTEATQPTVVLSYGFWQSRFAGRRDIIGSMLDIDGTPTRVVGVMPPDFSFPRAGIQLYLPFRADATRRFGWYLTGIARLRPGVSVADAQSQATDVMWEWARTNADLLSVPSIKPEATHMRALVVPLRTAITGEVARPLAVLQAAVLLLLLIAVANIATLVSSRGTARAAEIAVRTALGASVSRVARQLVTESLLMAVIGGVAGVALAVAGVHLFATSGLSALPRIGDVTVNWRVLAFALAISIGSGILFGLAPTFRVVRDRALAGDLAGGARASARGPARRLHNMLIVAQLALCVVLLISAGLVLQSFRRLTDTELGFDPRGVVAVTVPLPMKKYMNPDVSTAATNALVERVRTLPGVRDAAAASYLPYNGRTNTDGFLVEGHAPPPNAGAETQVVQLGVTPDFFRVLRIPLRYGRTFDAHDGTQSAPDVIVDEAFAGRFWRGADAIGRRMRFTGDTTWLTIVGVVGSVRDEDVATAGRPHAYVPYAQDPGTRPALAIATNGDPATVIAEVRRAVAELEPAAPVTDVHPLTSAVAHELGTRRLTELLLGGFALLAVVLAVVGIYGVMMLHVASRSREFGIRMAVGAEPSQVVRLVMREGAALATTGAITGVAGALLATRTLQALLYEVSPTDARIFTGLTIALVAVAMAACYRPARRAAMTDPIGALRAE